MLGLVIGIQVVVIFLFLTNAHLSGTSKANIASWLGWLWAGCAVAAIVNFGWDGAGSALGASVIAPFALRGLAARAAAVLMGIGAANGGGAYPGAPPSELRRISKVLGDYSSVHDPAKLLAELSAPGPRKKDVALNELLAVVVARPSCAKVLNEFGVDQEGLREVYRRIATAGGARWAGAHFAAASAIYFEDSLRYLLEQERAKAAPLDTAYNLIEHFQSGSPLRDARAEPAPG